MASRRGRASNASAGVDEDAGQPGVEILGLAELFVVQKALVHRLVHRVQRVGLAAQIEPRGAVEPGLDGLGAVGKFLFRQGWRPPF